MKNRHSGWLCDSRRRLCLSHIISSSTHCLIVTLLSKPLCFSNVFIAVYIAATYAWHMLSMKKKGRKASCVVSHVRLSCQAQFNNIAYMYLLAYISLKRERKEREGGRPHGCSLLSGIMSACLSHLSEKKTRQREQAGRLTSVFLFWLFSTREIVAYLVRLCSVCPDSSLCSLSWEALSDFLDSYHCIVYAQQHNICCLEKGIFSSWHVRALSWWSGSSHVVSLSSCNHNCSFSAWHGSRLTPQWKWGGRGGLLLRLSTKQWLMSCLWHSRKLNENIFKLAMLSITLISAEERKKKKNMLSPSLRHSSAQKLSWKHHHS